MRLSDPKSTDFWNVVTKVKKQHNHALVIFFGFRDYLIHVLLISILLIKWFMLVVILDKTEERNKNSPVIYQRKCLWRQILNTKNVYLLWMIFVIDPWRFCFPKCAVCFNKRGKDEVLFSVQILGITINYLLIGSLDIPRGVEINLNYCGFQVELGLLG